MAKYIDVESLVVAYSGHTPDDEFSNGGDFVLDLLDSKQSVDVRPVVRGRWMKDSDGLYICSECGEMALQRVFIKLPKKIVDLQMVQSAFCPHCGADMRETEE